MLGFLRRNAPISAELRGDPLENPSVSLIDAKAWASVFGALRSSAGVDVNPETALSIPAVWLAVNFLSKTMALLPITVSKKLSNGNLKPQPNHPLQKLLAGKVNEDLLTSWKWRSGEMAKILLGGRSYTFIERNPLGEVINLWPLDPSKMKAKKVTGRTVYEYRETMFRTSTYSAAEVLDLAYLMGSDGLSHFSPVSLLRDALGLVIAQRTYASKFFQNGGVPPLALQGALPGSPAAIARASDDMQAGLRRAAAESKNVVVLPAGYELKSIGVDPEDMQLLEAQIFGVQEVARIYNVPPAFLHELSKGGLSNVEQQNLNFVMHCLQHWTSAWEAEINAKLASENLVAHFDLDQISRGDFKTMMAGLAQGVQSAVLTPNEARRRVQRPPKQGGDVLYMNGAIVPIDKPPAPESGVIPLADPAKPDPKNPDDPEDDNNDD